MNLDALGVTSFERRLHIRTVVLVAHTRQLVESVGRARNGVRKIILLHVQLGGKSALKLERRSIA